MKNVPASLSKQEVIKYLKSWKEDYTAQKDVMDFDTIKVYVEYLNKSKGPRNQIEMYQYLLEVTSLYNDVNSKCTKDIDKMTVRELEHVYYLLNTYTNAMIYYERLRASTEETFVLNGKDGNETVLFSKKNGLKKLFEWMLINNKNDIVRIELSEEEKNEEQSKKQVAKVNKNSVADKEEDDNYLKISKEGMFKLVKYFEKERSVQSEELSPEKRDETLKNAINALFEQVKVAKDSSEKTENEVSKDSKDAKKPEKDKKETSKNDANTKISDEKVKDVKTEKGKKCILPIPLMNAITMGVVFVFYVIFFHFYPPTKSILVPFFKTVNFLFKEGVKRK